MDKVTINKSKTEKIIKSEAYYSVQEKLIIDLMLKCEPKSNEFDEDISPTFFIEDLELDIQNIEDLDNYKAIDKNGDFCRFYMLEHETLKENIISFKKIENLTYLLEWQAILDKDQLDLQSTVNFQLYTDGGMFTL